MLHINEKQWFNGNENEQHTETPNQHLGKKTIKINEFVVKVTAISDILVGSCKIVKHEYQIRTGNKKVAVLLKISIYKKIFTKCTHCNINAIKIWRISNQKQKDIN